LNKEPLLVLLSIFTTVLLMGGCQPEAEENKDNGSLDLVAAYLSTWSNWDAETIKGEYLTDIIIAFFFFYQTNHYSLYIPEGTAAIMTRVAALKEKYPLLRVNISVGGFGAEGFSDMANDPALREQFVAEVCGWLTRYKLDGVDIDWEYPVGPSWGQEIKSRPQDKQNYISLLRDLRNAMDELGEETGKRYGLSTAVPASDWFIRANDIKTASEIVDGFKLMAYDYYGSWSGTTGHNANLYRSSGGTWSTDDAVKAYLAANIPPEKLILGVAFYGQAWNGVTAGSSSSVPGLFRPATFMRSPSWTEIKGAYLKSDSGYTRYWDNNAKAPFLYNGSRWISYTDHEQIRLLTAYAKERKLGGVFAWEYAQDMGAELLQTMAESSR
jgi:chitinase